MKPEIGLVVKYDFLWKDDQKQGHTEGAKHRPCMIVQTRETKQGDGHHVYLLPITHTAPKPDERAVEIPYQVARKLNLDHDRMWIKTHEVNHLTWPKDQIPFGLEKTPQGNMSYGVMRHDIGKQAFQQVAERIQSRTLAQVNREDDYTPSRTPTREQARVPQQRVQNPRDRGGGDRDRGR